MLPDSVSLGLMASYEFEGGPYYVPAWIRAFFKCAFYEFYTDFELSIALMVVCWRYCLLYINWFTELPEPICNEGGTHVWHYFLGNTIICKYYFYHIDCWQALQSFDDWKFSVVIYNTQVVFIFEMKYVCTENFHGLSGMLWWVIFSFGCISWNLRHVAQCFM